MALNNNNWFTTIKTEGGLLPADLLHTLISKPDDFPGTAPSDYHLGSEKLTEAITSAWLRLQNRWQDLNDQIKKLPKNQEGKPLTALTRERWLLPLFLELGYGRLPGSTAIEMEGKSFPISHSWMHTPIHLVGIKVKLDKRTPGVAGAARFSPHSMVQEFLNLSDNHLWAFISNGRTLRILRDNISLTRQAFVEFDLQAMMDGEVYSDFVALWLLCHQSRVEADKPEECWLEQWHQRAADQGIRVLDNLRVGVERAITELGKGFLKCPHNLNLKDNLKNGTLSTSSYYRQLLRLVYRMIFLFVAESRGLLFHPDTEEETKLLYMQHYSLSRLRERSEIKETTRHIDLWQSLKVLFRLLNDPDKSPKLGLFPLGSQLWSNAAIPDLLDTRLVNRHLLLSVFHLSYVVNRKVRQIIDYRNLGPEELGSVYESLLELHPVINLEVGSFALHSIGGSERKTTGSYYTPTSLINSLLDTALEPVLQRALNQKDPQRALLDLKICDPACGSGHFLVAAAHRMAKRLAFVRTGDEEPAPEAQRTALRDVIGHCIYGVDINPMSVELCKVALWMEALEPGKPLSFLDHRIRCGNSLIGATPASINKGIPDEAFSPIEGDNKKITSTYRKINKKERQQGLRSLFSAEGGGWEELNTTSRELLRLDQIEDATLEGIRQKQRLFDGIHSSKAYAHHQFIADTWCAAFLIKKEESQELHEPITHDLFTRIKKNPDAAPEWMKKEIRRLSVQYRFFHWHLEFLDVFVVPPDGQTADNPHTGWSGGFDVVLGNPPWEHTELKEKEWFSSKDSDISNARSGNARKKRIQKLCTENPKLFIKFVEAKREHDAVSHFVRSSNQYPLCGRGRINTYAIFAELNRQLMNSSGRVGCIVPSGIATDDTTKFFFQDLMDTRSLVSLFDFENRKGLFPGVHKSYKFCLLTLSGSDDLKNRNAEFIFFALQVADLKDPERRFSLTPEEIALINPNTRTCPIFRSRKDAELTKYIYRRVPVLINENDPKNGNPWGISFKQGLFNMTSDSHLFRTQEELESYGWELHGNVFLRDNKKYLPLYEAKMIHHYNHRFGDYRDLPKGSKSTQLPEVPLERLQDPDYTVLPRYWVPEEEVPHRLPPNTSYLMGWRDITNSTNERTVIATFFPISGVGHTMPLLFTQVGPLLNMFLIGVFSSFIFDYFARQKIGGTHLTYNFLKQFPVHCPEHQIRLQVPWLYKDQKVLPWIASRVQELLYPLNIIQTQPDKEAQNPKLLCDPNRRRIIQNEIDAAIFFLYLFQDADDHKKKENKKELLDFIMESFLIIKRKDEKQFRSYRTKTEILDIFQQMCDASETGVAFKSKLDPPPQKFQFDLEQLSHYPEPPNANNSILCPNCKTPFELRKGTLSNFYFCPKCRKTVVEQMIDKYKKAIK